jgi:hypothetical protein
LVPASLNRSRIAGSAALLALLGALAVLLSPAGASGSDNASTVPASQEPPPAAALDVPSDDPCPGDPRQPFGQWDDNETYMLAPGGAFESDATDWFVDGDATITDENEPWYVRDAGDGHSLDVPAGSSVTSPTICITRDHPNFRFFARSDGNAGATLKVEVLFRDKHGRLHDPKVGYVSFDSGRIDYDPEWQVSPQFPVVANNYLQPGESDEIELRFTPQRSRSSWEIDDVYVDPRHRS